MRLEQLITGNDAVQRHVAAERGEEPEGLVVVSPYARTAINKEILPQLDENVTSAGVVDGLRDQTKATIEAAFKSKDPVYTRLIGHKSIDQSDNQFLKDLLHVMDEWARKTKDSLGQQKEIEEIKEEGGAAFVIDLGGDLRLSADNTVADVEEDTGFDLQDVR